MSKDLIFGGRVSGAETIHEKTLRIPLEDGVTYELPIKYGAIYPSDRQEAMSKVSEFKGGQSTPRLSFEALRKMNMRLVLKALKGWGGANGGNPLGFLCKQEGDKGCGKFVIDEKLSNQYNIDQCRCDDPNVEEDESGGFVGTQMPCDKQWIPFVLDGLNARIDSDRSRDPNDNDIVLLASDYVLRAAQDVVKGAYGLTGEEEGNSET